MDNHSVQISHFHVTALERQTQTCKPPSLLPFSVSINWSSLFIQIQACFQIQILSEKNNNSVMKMPGGERCCFFLSWFKNTEQEDKRTLKRDRCNSILNESLAEALISGIGGVLIECDSLKEAL